MLTPVATVSITGPMPQRQAVDVDDSSKAANFWQIEKIPEFIPKQG
jgi:hypothetical protein